MAMLCFLAKFERFVDCYGVVIYRFSGGWGGYVFPGVYALVETHGSMVVWVDGVDSKGVDSRRTCCFNGVNAFGFAGGRVNGETSCWQYGSHSSFFSEMCD